MRKTRKNSMRKDSMRIVKLKPDSNHGLSPKEVKELTEGPALYELSPANPSGMVFIGTTPAGGNIATFVHQSCLEYID